MRDAVIVGAARSPIGKKNGKLSGIHPTDLLGMVLQGLIDRAGIDPLEIDDVIGGCVTQTGEQGVNVTRNAWIAAGLPWEVPATSVDRQCGSAQQAIHFGAQGVMAGQYDLVIGCGVEAMSRVGLGKNAIEPGFAFSPAWMDAVDQQLFTQFQAAQEIARRWDITREDMDTLAVESHRRATQATDEGRFNREIVPIKVTQPDGSVEEMTTDECIRRETTLEKLASLSPVREDCPDITAGNSSPYSDGAAAVLIASPEKAEQLGLTPRARFHGFSVAACEPIVMLQGPIPATQKILKRTRMSLDDIDIFECNEAMGSIVPMWEREFGIDHAKVNVNGSGISLGHPVGATGARLMVTLLHELERTGGRYGFQTMCEGGGQGNATIIERLN
ncbi:MAG: acetyl-CoA C-acyltransferase [Actinomycetota bacterium]|nr:thiolase family protein [Actinomycetota bacterium]